MGQGNNGREKYLKTISCSHTIHPSSCISGRWFTLAPYFGNAARKVLKSLSYSLDRVQSGLGPIPHSGLDQEISCYLLCPWFKLPLVGLGPQFKGRGTNEIAWTFIGFSTLDPSLKVALNILPKSSVQSLLQHVENTQLEECSPSKAQKKQTCSFKIHSHV